MITEKEKEEIANKVKEKLQKSGVTINYKEVDTAVRAYLSGYPFSNPDEIIQMVTEQFLKKEREQPAKPAKSAEPIKQTEVPYFDLYSWACRLTAEQKEEEEYFPSKEAKMLLRRLLTTRGNLIAVIGLQGSGKTALRQWLYREIIKINKIAYSAKWTGENELIRNILGDFSFEEFLYNDEEYLENLRVALAKRFGVFKRNMWDTKYKIIDVERTFKSKLKEEEIRFLREWIFGDDVDLKDKESIIPVVEKFLGKNEINFLREELIKGKIETADTILIDFPDYDKNSRGRMLKDLQNFQEWWEKNIARSEGYEQGPNIVIFFQKELFSGHFSFGKFDVIELKPWPAEALADYINKRFKHPFTQEALLEIAALSNGIWRRFKKYIRICLDYAMDEEINTITVEHVKRWISFEQIMKDMELELMDIFPKNKELRKKAVIVLQALREKGKLDQPTITQEIFDNNKMQASRVLNSLEAHGYISCRYENRVKVWSVEKWK